MAEGLARVLVQAALRRREHEATVLDRARADERVPVRLAGLPGECRRYGEERGSGLGGGPIERRESQIVTDGKPQPAPRQIGEHRAIAGAERARLPIALAVREIDIE